MAKQTENSNDALVEDEVDVSDLIDNGPLGRFQIIGIVLCGVVAMFDGFDMQALAFVAASISSEFEVPLASFGPVFAAALIGLAIGSVVLGPVGDKLGRKIVVIGAMTTFSLFSLMTATATDINQLFVYRLLTGIGLGAAIPNIIALTAEYSPRRRRALLVSVMFCGVPIGAIVGGIVSATWLIPAFGWRSVFYAGGLAPLAVLPLVMLYLPESIRFLITRQGHQTRAKRLLIRTGLISPNHLQPNTQLTQPEHAVPGVPVRQLFTEGRAGATLALWIAFFMNLLVMHFLISWLPAVLAQSGVPLERAIIGTVVLNIGGIIGGAVLAYCIDLRSAAHHILGASYFLGAVFTACIGLLVGSAAQVMTFIFLAGVFIIGAQLCANALAAEFYPTPLRSTGVGWAMTAGRIGSIVGPAMGGVMLALDLGVREIFLITAIPAAIAAAAVLLMRTLRPPVVPHAHETHLQDRIRIERASTSESAR